MPIEVKGNNNRVAGRDYYELNIKPCPTCETRVIEPERDECNHCTRLKQAEAAKMKMVAFSFCVLMMFNWVKDWYRAEDVVNGPFVFFETLLLSAFLVLVLYGLGSAVFHWLNNR